MSFIKVPLHHVVVDTRLVSGCFKVAVRPALPVPDIDLIMGNDIAGDKVYPLLEVTEHPEAQAMPCDSEAIPDIYPACVSGVRQLIWQTPSSPLHLLLISLLSVHLTRKR